LASCGTWNSKVFNKETGMPTLAELMASLGAVQAAGMGQTGALLTQTAEQERRDIEQAYIDLERQQREKEEAARKREKKRGRFRLAGKVLGTLLGGGTPLGTAIGAGIGSALGQTAAGRDRLGTVSAPLAKGMFFKTGREKLTSNVEDINSMLASAEEQYGEAVWSSALLDALSGYALGKTDILPGAKALMKGDIGLKEFGKVLSGRYAGSLSPDADTLMPKVYDFQMSPLYSPETMSANIYDQIIGKAGRAESRRIMNEISLGLGSDIRGQFLGR